MNDLIVFIRARVDEDAVIAAGAGGPEWHRDGMAAGRVEDAAGEIVVYDEGRPNESQAEHMARHDPARVVRQSEAMRWVLDWLVGLDDSEVVLRKLALVWQDHDDFRGEWRV